VKTIILATRNQGKVREIRSLINDLPLEIISLLEMPDVPEVVEDGETFQENALKKATSIFQATGIPALADDSGLEVFSLDMQPGIYSARYAGERVSYADNNRKLLAAMKSFTANQRRARFRCAAVFIANKIKIITEGICNGRIIEELRGSGGFGYDPLFVPDGYQQTFAELPIEIKNQISHRAKALHEMKVRLEGYLQSI
jgi:XTP/dITP diphosphohydrolase